MQKPKMILVVDDDPNLLMFFNEYFRQEGYNAMLTEDPEKAVRMANVLHPDLLVIDIRMPKMDGFEVLAKMRVQTPEIKAVIVSAYTNGYEEKIRQANVQAVLKKPAKFEDLEKVILKLLNVSKAEIQDKIPPGGRPEVNVLLVDDEKEITECIGQALNEYGYKTDVANSGEEGLQKAKAKRYDIIITDNSMNDMSGFDMLRKIMSGVGNKPYAMAVVSGNTTYDLVDKYKELGVSHFLTKPCKFEELIRFMEEQVAIVAKRKQGA